MEQLVIKKATIENIADCLRAFVGNQRYSVNEMPDKLKQAFQADEESIVNLIERKGPTIAISNSVTSIGENVFNSFSGLNSINIPGSVTTIGTSAFELSGLRSLTLNNGLISIGDRAFYNSLLDGSLVIPESVTSIGTSAFYYTGLDELIFSSGCATKIGANAFEKSGLKKIEFSDYIPSIGTKAFINCKGLTSVTIPRSATLGNYAFQNCTGLTDVVFAEGAKNTGNYTFYGCTSLKNVTLPNSLTSVGAHVFYNCSGLNSITFPSGITSAISISNGAFIGSKIKTINVPWAEGAVAGAPWGATKATINYNYTG